MIPNPKKSWTTSEIAKELGVPLQAIYRHLQWLREAGFLTEDFPGKAEDPKKVRLWHYDLNKAWSGVENRARICLETYREIINNLNEKLKEAKNEVPSDMINVGKEEIFEINLREVKVEENSTYEDNLGILGRGIGLLSNHHYPYNESMPHKIIDECFKTNTGYSINEYKKNKNIPYKDLHKQNQNLEEELKELRAKYWDIHQILIKNRLN